jgi:tetratricopeptide (TPR) repeat protein
MPSKAAWVYCTLGRAYKNLGNFSKALEHHKEHLTMATEVGDRGGKGVAYANLGNAYGSQGDFSKAIKYTTQCLAIAKELLTKLLDLRWWSTICKTAPGAPHLQLLRCGPRGRCAGTFQRAPLMACATGT